MRDHLEQAARQTGKVPARLTDAPELWPAAEHLWAYFLDLNQGRGGLAPLAYGEVAAWAQLNGVSLAGWELRALKDLDRAWCVMAARAIEKQTKTRPRR